MPQIMWQQCIFPFFVTRDQRVANNQYEGCRLEGDFTVATSHEEAAIARNVLRTYRFHIVLTHDEDLRVLANSSVFGCFCWELQEIEHKFFLNLYVISTV
jgi:hypothetical protein